MTARTWHCWRVTKFDPSKRDASDVYQSDEWTAFGDVGENFSGVKLRQEEYERVELQYLDSIRRFADSSCVTELRIRDVEGDCAVADTTVQLERAIEISRHVLRAECWCRLESLPQDFFVHFGQDYYMYICSQALCTDAVELTQQDGLFVEDFPSPYLDLVEVTLMEHPDEKAIKELISSVVDAFAETGAGLVAHVRNGDFSRSFRCLGPEADVMYAVVEECLNGFPAGEGSYVYIEGRGRERRVTLA